MPLNLSPDSRDADSLSDDLQQLVSAVVRTSALDSLAKRREVFLNELGELIQADMGFWCWGRGHPSGNTLLPLAMMGFKMTADMQRLLLEIGLKPEMNESHLRCTQFFGPDGQFSVIRSDVFPDEEWLTHPPYRLCLAEIGMDSFAESVRYSVDDNWSNLFYARRIGGPEFTPRDRTMVRIAMAAVTWLHASEKEFEPSLSFSDLTTRERTVVLYLLDGLSRKQIANCLGISLHTVSDHIKSLYRRLGVHTLNELAAKMLRNA